MQLVRAVLQLFEAHHVLLVMPTASVQQVHIRRRSATAASQECCRQRFPTRAATIHAQVHQIPHSDRARRTAACAHYPRAARVCVTRRLDVNSMYCSCYARGLLYGQALVLKALALRYA